MNRETLVPLTGVLFLVLLGISFAVGGEPPGADDGAQKVVDHYIDNKDSIMAGAFISGLAAVALVFFVGYLRKVLSAADGGNSMLPTTALVGAGIVAVGAAIDGTISIALAEAAEDLDPLGAQALQALWDNDFLPLAVGTIIFLFSVGISVVQSGVLPKWLGWAAIVLAVIGCTPLGFVGAIGAALWILVASVMLAMRGPATT